MLTIIKFWEHFVGLDAGSSFDLLNHLNKLADSNRTVILTIHQPRLEIFHMFRHLVLLSDGKVSCHIHYCIHIHIIALLVYNRCLIAIVLKRHMKCLSMLLPQSI